VVGLPCWCLTAASRNGPQRQVVVVLRVAPGLLTIAGRSLKDHLETVEEAEA
jgi:hypothetical protein